MLFMALFGSGMVAGLNKVSAAQKPNQTAEPFFFQNR